MYCKFDHSEMIFGPFEKMTFLGEHPLRLAATATMTRRMRMRMMTFTRSRVTIDFSDLDSS